MVYLVQCIRSAATTLRTFCWLSVCLICLMYRPWHPMLPKEYYLWSDWYIFNCYLADSFKLPRFTRTVKNISQCLSHLVHHSSLLSKSNATILLLPLLEVFSFSLLFSTFTITLCIILRGFLLWVCRADLYFFLITFLSHDGFSPDNLLFFE